MDGWMNGWMYMYVGPMYTYVRIRMDGWMDGWMDGYMDVFRYMYIAVKTHDIILIVHISYKIESHLFASIIM